jgi:hypothetical protein
MLSSSADPPTLGNEAVPTAPSFEGAPSGNDSAPFLSIAAEAAHAEARAIELDRNNQVSHAIAAYRETAELLTQAISACPEDHPDKITIARHTGEVMGRVVYLQSLGESAVASAPVEMHISTLRLSDGSAASASSKPSRVKTALSAAAVAGGAGLLIAHGPIAAVVCAIGAGYATTRSDAAGEAARGLGDAGIHAAKKVDDFDKKHKIKERVSEQADAAWDKAKTVDEKYGVLAKTKEAAITTRDSVCEFDQKHQVTKQIGDGVVKATSTVAGWMNGSSSSSRQGTASSSSNLLS